MRPCRIVATGQPVVVTTDALPGKTFRWSGSYGRDFNAAKTLTAAVESVLAQGDIGVNVILVDDCSTDDSVEVITATLAGLDDSRFSLVRLGKNVGQTGATRAGLKRTNAPFVCFLDSDDLWHEDFLERHLAAHLNETYAVGFTACNARLIDGKGKLIAGCVYWFGKERASADRDRAFAPVDPARVPQIDVASGTYSVKFPRRMVTSPGRRPMGSPSVISTRPSRENFRTCCPFPFASPLSVTHTLPSRST